MSNLPRRLAPLAENEGQTPNKRQEKQQGLCYHPVHDTASTLVPVTSSPRFTLLTTLFFIVMQVLQLPAGSGRFSTPTPR